MEEITTEEVWLCNICKSELREGCNDWDSFHICDICNLDNFTHSKLEPIHATKQTVVTTEISYIYEPVDKVKRSA